MEYVFLATGLAIGAALGWLLGARRSATPDARLENELRQQLAQREAELGQIRARAAEDGAARAAAEAARAAADKTAAEQRQRAEQAAAEAAGARESLARSQSALAAAEANLAAARRAAAEQQVAQEQNLKNLREAQEKALADLRDTFKALSLEALKQTQPEFLRLAGETLARFQESAKGDLGQRQEAIAGLVKPLEQMLKTYQERLQQSENAQSNALGEVKQHLELLAKQSETLANETQQFRQVLKSAPARGRWGEETLRRVVEAAGLSVHCDFAEQTQSDDKKPDLIVRLPGDRLIIVDAKVPDFDFLAAQGEADPAKRSQDLAAHAAKLKATIRALADRDYPGQFPGALDCVVLFLPAESLFSAALEGDRDLIVWAAEKKILLTTPASLIALLRSVSVSWQHHRQTENAQAIAAAAQELYTRVVKLMEHFDNIRKGLHKAAESYNDAVGSFERMVRPSGERLLQLGGGASRPLPDITPLDQGLRLPPAD